MRGSTCQQEYWLLFEYSGLSCEHPQQQGFQLCKKRSQIHFNGLHKVILE